MSVILPSPTIGICFSPGIIATILTSRPYFESNSLILRLLRVQMLLIFICISGRKEAVDVKADFDVLVHYMDHENKFNLHKVITEGHNKGLDVKK